MSMNRVWSAVVIGFVFMTLGFSRPQNQLTWFLAGAGFMLIGLLRWLRIRRNASKGSAPSDDSTTQF